MANQTDPRIHVRAVRLSGWRAVVAVLAGLAVLVAVAAFLALGFLFVVLPTLVLASVAYYFLPNPPIPSGENKGKMEPSGNATIIDGTYQVAQDDPGETGNGHK